MATSTPLDRRWRARAGASRSTPATPASTTGFIERSTGRSTAGWRRSTRACARSFAPKRSRFEPGSASRRRQVGAGPLERFGSEADRFAQRRVRMDRLADVDRVGAHLDRQRDLADHVAGVRADDAAADDGVGRLVEEQLGEAFVAAVGDGTARRRPREQALLHLDAPRLGLVLGDADPGDLRVGVGDARDHARVERGLGELRVAELLAGGDLGGDVRLMDRLAVSYTHLTLPT